MGMTRSLASRLTRSQAPAARPMRDPSITALGFECFRLEYAGRREPDEPAFIPIRLLQPRSAMGAFVSLR